jgi:hypothetical protein
MGGYAMKYSHDFSLEDERKQISSDFYNDLEFKAMEIVYEWSKNAPHKNTSLINAELLRKKLGINTRTLVKVLNSLVDNAFCELYIIDENATSFDNLEVELTQRGQNNLINRILSHRRSYVD